MCFWNGGTIGGVSKFLKEKNKDVKIYLSDPTGSALYNYITNGELKAEGGSITEGIGSSRITKNFAEAKIDGAYSISDEESLPIPVSYTHLTLPTTLSV